MFDSSWDEDLIIIWFWLERNFPYKKSCNALQTEVQRLARLVLKQNVLERQVRVKAHQTISLLLYIFTEKQSCGLNRSSRSQPASLLKCNWNVRGSLKILLPESKVTPQRCRPVNPGPFKEQSQGNLSMKISWKPFAATGHHSKLSFCHHVVGFPTTKNYQKVWNVSQGPAK